MGVHIALWISAFKSLECMYESGISESYGNFILSLIFLSFWLNNLSFLISSVKTNYLYVFVIVPYTCEQKVSTSRRVLIEIKSDLVKISPQYISSLWNLYSFILLWTLSKFSSFFLSQTNGTMSILKTLASLIQNKRKSLLEI